jgi:hypothetical protein
MSGQKNLPNLYAKEWQEQATVFEWANAMSQKYHDLMLLNGSLNGVKLTIGQAVKCKRLGMRKGFPDINLPVKRYPYSGLYIELKVPGGRESKEQRWWGNRLKEQGYMYSVCWGADAAIELIDEYLSGYCD